MTYSLDLCARTTYGSCRWWARWTISVNSSAYRYREYSLTSKQCRITNNAHPFTWLSAKFKVWRIEQIINRLWTDYLRLLLLGITAILREFLRSLPTASVFYDRKLCFSNLQFLAYPGFVELHPASAFWSVYSIAVFILAEYGLLMSCVKTNVLSVLLQNTSSSTLNSYRQR